MKKWLNRTRTELQEVYGENYPRFVKSEWLSFSKYPLVALYCLFIHHPLVIKTLDTWEMLNSWSLLVLLFSFLLIIGLIHREFKVKLSPEMKQQFKQTIYAKRIRVITLILVGLISCLIVVKMLDDDSYPSISNAVTAYDYSVDLPTILPFNPTNQEAAVKISYFSYDLEVFYEKDDTHLVLSISKEDEEDLSLSNATLQNGIKADYEDGVLTWYQDGFRYQLNYSPSKSEVQPSKEVMLNIANSAKPVIP